LSHYSACYLAQLNDQANALGTPPHSFDLPAPSSTSAPLNGSESSSEDSDIELLSERVQRMELDAFSFLSGLGPSSHLQLREKVARLQQAHGVPQAEESTPQPQTEADFVSRSAIVQGLQLMPQASGSQRCMLAYGDGRLTLVTPFPTTIFSWCSLTHT
jgi:hypothetical protein